MELESRLGRVGSIAHYDPSESLESADTMKSWVAQVASLSYGNEAAKNPSQLFDRIVKLGHLSCLEFVPSYAHWGTALPDASLRGLLHYNGCGQLDELRLSCVEDKQYVGPLLNAHAFLVECPIFVARQWMRHRSFSYLEMSRRYVKGSKIGFEFYGPRSPFHDACQAEYDKRISIGEPAELARGCMPVETMTKFWVAGYERDWFEFVRLRSDAHAQAEIRVFADAIKEMISWGEDETIAQGESK